MIERIIRTVEPAESPSPPEWSADLLRAVLAVTAELDLPSALDRFVSLSTALTAASYGAINVLDDRGSSTTFVQTGVPSAVAAIMANAPHATGVLGQIPDEGVLMLDDLTQHPAFLGFPPGHPPMGAFLGAAVRIGETVFGYLYLADKQGGFTDADADVVQALAAAAGVAVGNAHLYADAARREHWLRAGQEITTMLLQGADEEEALDRIAVTALEVAGADTAALALPNIGGELVIELAQGHAANTLIGHVLPRNGRSRRVMTDGRGELVDSLSRANSTEVAPLRAFGPALFAPLQAEGRGIGVLIVLRRIGAHPFVAGDLDTAESFAAQAALAFILAEARHAQDLAALVEERERIARDLHDMAIQQLFATGMQLETVRRRSARGVDPAELTTIVEEALDNVDSSVREIRAIVHALRDPDTATGLVERLRRESSLARTGLGFAPSLVVTRDDEVITGDDDAAAERIEGLLAADLADDVVAVVREGLANAARHAQATSVAVHVEVRGSAPTGTVLVEVLDDGVGLPTSRQRRSGTGNLAARARQHGGTFTIGTPASGRGTLLAWQAPLS